VPKKIGNNVLIVCQHFWPESFRINDIANFLIDKSCGVDVLCGIPNYPKGHYFTGYSITKNRHQIINKLNIHRAFEIPRGNNSNIRIFINYISFPIASLFHIPRLLMKKYDKILLYQLSPVMMSITGILVGKIKKTETIMYILDLWPENLFSVMDVKNHLLRKLVTKISHWHYKNVDKIIVLSERMKQRIIEVTNIPNEKIIVLPQACEKIYEKRIHDPEIESRFNKGFNIVYTGNISPAQSFDTILDAAEMLKFKGIDDINWIIVGEGMSYSWLKKEVIKRNLESCFFFEGQKPIEDIPKYTNIADVLVGCLVKSDLLEATIPAKVMSYLAAGRPVILAMDGEAQVLINKIIRCGYAGPAGDPKSLYRNIYKMHGLNNKDRITMGKLAQSYHLKHFERNLILNRMYNFIFDRSEV